MFPPGLIRLLKLMITGFAFGTVVNWSLYVNYSIERRHVMCPPSNATRLAVLRNVGHNLTTVATNHRGVPSLTFHALENGETNRHPYVNNSNPRRIRLMQDIPEVIYKTPYGHIPNQCNVKKYNTTHMPSVSVIITYHDNEDAVDILRTVESILRRTNRNLLKEIILVDDHSTKEELVSVLQQYLHSVYAGELVKVRRNPEKPGLIQARHYGIMTSTGDVVVCMDSHMEVQQQWLEPLLQAIVENSKTLASSYLDWIEYSQVDDKWHYKTGGSTWKTYFDWSLNFGFQDISAPERQNRQDNTEPIESPVMVGTLWAMRKQYYIDVGGLDQNLEGWGGENIDLPFKVWLSGGRVVNVPCSHAAHLEDIQKRHYRNRNEWLQKIDRNYQRVAEQWFADYKKYYYFYKTPIQVSKQLLRTNTVNSTTDVQSQTRHNFTWFLKNIFPELGMFEEDSLAYGRVQNVRYNSTCLHWNSANQPDLSTCSNYKRQKQTFIWSSSGELRLQLHIVNRAPAHSNHRTDLPLVMDGYITTYRSSNNLKWLHSKAGQIEIYTTEDSDEQWCLAAKDAYTLVLQVCNQTNNNQHWRFEHYAHLYASEKLKNLSNFDNREHNEYTSHLAAYVSSRSNGDTVIV